MAEQKRSTDLNKPELTGRRRFRAINSDWSYHAGGHILVLEVEESVYTEVSGVRGWETRFRFAEPKDILDLDVVGLPDKTR